MGRCLLFQTMKMIPLLFASLMVAIPTMYADEANSSKATDNNVVADKSEWKLIWSDEFNKSGKVDPKKWNIEKEFVRNENAQQLYTDNSKNIKQAGGMLVLQALAEKRKNKNFDSKSNNWRFSREFADYTSGSVNSQGKFSFMYGKVEIKAKLEHGKGVWPALWLIGDNIKKVSWPACGEIDILEYISQDKQKVHGTFHWGKSSSLGGGHTKNFVVPDLLDKFHTYGMIWTPEKLELTFDGKVFHTLDLSKAQDGDYNAFRQPFHFIMNLAIGGWAEKADPKDYPRKFLIDYIRVYQQKGDPNAEYWIDGQKKKP